MQLVDTKPGHLHKLEPMKAMTTYRKGQSRLDTDIVLKAQIWHELVFIKLQRQLKAVASQHLHQGISSVGFPVQHLSSCPVFFAHERPWKSFMHFVWYTMNVEAQD